MSEPRPDKPDHTTLEQRFGSCPYATAQSLISGKWAILILHYLQNGPLRFNELLRRMPAMTHATLSVQLKALVGNGLVARTQYESIPPKVEYSLTESGEKFRPVLDALETWANDYIARTGVKRQDGRGDIQQNEADPAAPSGGCGNTSKPDGAD